MNYKRNKDEFSIIADKIIEYKFKQKHRKIYDNANLKVILKYAQWEERCSCWKIPGLTFRSFPKKGEVIIFFP